MAPGVPEIFPFLKDVIESDARFTKHGLSMEHYIVSTGLAQMIKGSVVAPHVDDIWACEFAETIANAGYLEKAADNTLALLEITPEERRSHPIQGIGYHIDNTTKTRALFEINKGVNKDSSISVNDKIKYKERRVPFEHMIYVADGPSDVPVFSVMNSNNGRTYAVYDPHIDNSYEQAKALNDQGRVQAFGEMDYQNHSVSTRWLVASVREIAEAMCREREVEIDKTVGKPPTHLT